MPSSRLERHPDHAVDRPIQLVEWQVAFLGRDVVAEDVADRQRARRLDARAGRQEEERRRLHLESQHAAIPPALGVVGIGVVEDIDRCDEPGASVNARCAGRIHQRPR